jgi:hypothetical protein
VPLASVPDAPTVGAVTDASAPTASTAHSLAVTMWTAAQLKGLAHVAAFFLSGPPAGPLTGVAPATLGAAGAVLGGLLTSALLLGACAPVGGSSAGPGGAGPGALALASVSPLVAHRAWVRRRGRTDDEAPAAPTFDTDVSPD